MDAPSPIASTRACALACALALVAGCAEPDTPAASVTPVAPAPPAAPAPVEVVGVPLPSLAPVLAAVTPAVVNISTVAASSRATPLMDDPFFRRFFEGRGGRDGRSPGGAPEPRSLGSGVIVDAAEGLVLTNEHVIANAAAVLVTLADGREYEAERLGSDPEADIALVRIEADDLVELEWADSDALRVGDFCIAIGNPFGLGQTVTSGIVSALGRSGLGIERFEDFIQTDASINPGNSGGALVGLDGRLIGINTAIVGPSGGNVGIGFAIPANLARDLVEQLVETGEVRRGGLGIAMQPLTPELARALDAQGRRGVVVSDVREGSPADEAGLSRGDVIVRADGRAVDDVGDVRNRIGLVRLGQSLSLTILRDGEERTLEAVVAALPTALALLDGARLADARTRGGRGVTVVQALEPDSPMARAGLAPGDIVLSVEGVRVRSVAQLERVAQSHRDALTLEVQRGRAVSRVRLTASRG